MFNSSNRDEMNRLKISAYGQHLLGCLVLLASYLPIAAEYYFHFPPSGFDFYQMAAYEAYIRRNFGLWTGLWKYVWFNGCPLGRDYPLLHMYLALPFASYLGDVEGCKAYLLLNFYLFSVFSYLLFFELSRKKALSLLMANVLVWSPNIYFTLFGGTLPFAATQMFSPLSLLLTVKYLNIEDRRFLFLSAALSGLSFLGHQVVGALLVFLPSLIVLLFWPKPRFFKRLRMILIYGVIILLVCMPAFARSEYDFLNLARGLWQDVQVDPGLYSIRQGPQAWNFFFTVNPFLYVILSFSLAYVILKRKLKGAVTTGLPFLTIFLFLILFQLLFFLGYNPFKTFIQPHRTYWLFPLVVGGMASVWLKDLFKPVNHLHIPRNFSNSVQAVENGLLLMLIVSPPLMAGLSMGDYLYGNCVGSRLINEALVKGQSSLLEEKIIPTWMNGSRTDYRIYTHNPYFAVWWNILFPMPVTHGYYAALSPDQVYWKSWLDAAFTGSLYVWGNYSTQIIKNQGLFLLNWFAIKYMVAGQGTGLNISQTLSETFKRTEENEGLRFIEAQENLTAPIVEATNVPAILVISNREWYRGVLRDLFASVNLNSKHCILVRGPEYIDDLSATELADFDSVYLYTYRYHDFDQAFGLLDQYVANGGNLIIDTGFECPESGSIHLPEFFPVNETVRSPLGKEWKFKVATGPITGDIDFSAFSPPLHVGDEPWTHSYAPSDRNVKPWAKVILWNHGRPVIVIGTYRKGRVVWSGLNLPYHVANYKNLEEAELHRNLMEWLLQPPSNPNEDYNVKRPRPEEVIIETHGNCTGILFKENAFDGWTAQLATKEGKTYDLKIHQAGPDFMYVRVPKGIDGPFTVRFVFKGALIDWFFTTLSLTTLFLILDYSLLRGSLVTHRLLSPLARGFKGQWKHLARRVREWWYKEE
ncbi:MAG: hypothetical protein QW231_04485 [Candidatus Bathyarchaeia archaeon]